MSRLFSGKTKQAIPPEARTIFKFRRGECHTVDHTNLPYKFYKNPQSCSGRTDRRTGQKNHPLQEMRFFAFSINNIFFEKERSPMNCPHSQFFKTITHLAVKQRVGAPNPVGAGVQFRALLHKPVFMIQCAEISVKQVYIKIIFFHYKETYQQRVPMHRVHDSNQYQFKLKRAGSWQTKFQSIEKLGAISHAVKAELFKLLKLIYFSLISCPPLACLWYQ